MSTDRLSYLLRQYLEDSLTKEEQEELDHLLREAHSGQMHAALEPLIAREQGLTDYQQADWEYLFQKIQNRASSRARVRRMTRGRWMAAAALLLLAASGWLIYSRHDTVKSVAVSSPVAPRSEQDVVPGSNKAVLTLADNSTIDLDDAKNGVLGQQGNTQLVKNKDGQLTYHTTAASPLAYNLLTTPRGGQYQLLLPDGSKVWLNAASSLRYPTSFSGKERVVELQGEAYFEIARNASMPFKVSIKSPKGQAPAEIEVLGTHFNVKAYEDEPAVRATLLEGSVRVRKGGVALPLQPGQQASWTGTTDIRIATADVEEAVAWKNGLFKFSEATVEDVMRQLSRWYDVEVVYTNGIPKDLFQGEIYRNVNVSRVLKVLEASGVHFTVDGKKILVQ
ncbi:MAG TPA: FecR domain-containing protein [Puia sp.]|jgi:ferric-dicitrate binding protein FerR (iron transport regulator)|nr:FecR domain-containing protein [Puia sp.]